MIVRQLYTALTLIILLTIITGVLYPALVTVLAQVIFPEQANGSILRKGGETFGSSLVGQPFGQPKYFWSRPSATAPGPYNAASSGGANYGPLHPALLDSVRQRVNALRTADPLNTNQIPVDLVTSSGSGLDPHISVLAALYQLPRVARSRHMTDAQVRHLVDRCTEGRQFGVLGEPRVNVLKLNLALDGLLLPEGK
jgi:K+-transporting ATPase ATPase C chain